jgi:hypothetical protein
MVVVVLLLIMLGLCCDAVGLVDPYVEVNQVETAAQRS